MHVTSRILKLIPLIAVVLLAVNGCGGGSEAGREGMTSEERVFEVLDRYGTWIDVPAYGTVWRPHVSPDWRPYVYGHWAWSDQGWVWVGYEPYAWIVYHYGSWYNDRGYGWVWVPAYDWSPAQVTWASSDDYVAWAPLSPPGAPAYQSGDPYWDQMWVLVPVAHFRDENVGKNNVAKDTQKLGRIRGATRKPPDVHKLRTASAVEDAPMKINLDRIASGGRDLLRLKLPPEQEQIVEKRAPAIQQKVLELDNGGGGRQSEDQQPVRPAEPPVRVVPEKDTQPVELRGVDTPSKQPQKINDTDGKPSPPPAAKQAEKPKSAQRDKKPAPHKEVKPPPQPKVDKQKSDDAKDNPR
jgi:hypothetical protein